MLKDPEIIWGSFATWMMIETGLMYLVYPVGYKGTVYRYTAPVKHWSVFSIYLSL